jgi:hypothetical protein
MIDAARAASQFDSEPKLQLHVLDGQPLLFNEQRQQLYAADRTAAFVLCCIQDGLDIAATEQKLADAASLTLAASRVVVREALAQLKSAAWPGEAVDGGSAAGPSTDAPPSATAVPRPATPRAVEISRLIALAGHGIEIACADRAVARRVLEPFSHLAAAKDRQGAIRIDVEAAGPGYVVFQDGGPVIEVGELEALTPALKAHLVQRILAREDYRLAVHAAALARRGKVLLLPGNAGSGKSTLAAALMAVGFSFLGDDTVVLEDDLRVRALPFALAVKAGAWDLLAPYHPSLAAVPVDRRPDGKLVRYLRPTAIAPGPLPVAWMIFPSWNGGVPPGLARLSRVDALRHFLPGCYASARRLRSQDMAQLIAWIAGIDCYTLDASDLSEAIALIEGLCR